jgi:hypothetical protein
VLTPENTRKKQVKIPVKIRDISIMKKQVQKIGMTIAFDRQKIKHE